MTPLTVDLPGIGGTAKERAADFRVDELPQYELSGKGRYLYLRVQKQNLTTIEVARQLAAAAGLKPKDIGYAGLKDAKAVTTQWFSLLTQAHDPPALEHPEVRILERSRHSRPLKPGELEANQFRLLVRDPLPDAEPRARTILEELRRRGVPNWFGPQRFGTKGDTDQIGRALYHSDFATALRLFLGAPSDKEDDPRLIEARTLFDEGRYEAAASAYPAFMQNERRVMAEYLNTADAERALRKLPKALRFLFLSAYQSRLFNRCLAQRLPNVDQVELGDVVFDEQYQSEQLVTDLAAEEPRVREFAASPTGPIFGPGIRLGRGAPRLLEQGVFEDEHLALDADQNPFRDIRLRGSRRPYRFPLEEAEVETVPEGLKLSFRLPPGCYATAVLLEVMKRGVPGL